MAAPEFRYGVFISYRHVDPDRIWAKWLHRELETYRVPKSLRRQGIPGRVSRVFRDEEELAASPVLSEAIDEALLQSAFLIVVCSPRTPGSRWVNQEVLRFRELGRADRILALLIEGEPDESFPRALREVRPVADRALLPAQVSVDEVEPLAADVRPTAGDSGRRLRRTAKLKLMATILGCRFDDLRQRDQERRLRQLSTLALVLGVLVIGITGLALYARTQQLRADREARVATAQRLAAQARVHFADRPDLAALLSTEASLLDDSPPVAASLLDSLENDARLNTFLRGHTAPVHGLAFSPDGHLLASGGDDHVIRLWNARTWEPVATLKNGHTGSVWSLAFSPDGTLLASGSTDQTVRLWNVATRAPVGAPLGGHTGSVRSIVFDRTGKVLLSSSATEGGENETFSWDLAAAPPTAKPFGGRPGSSGNLALRADGRLLAIGSGGTVSLWNLDTPLRLSQSLATEGVFLQSLAFSPDGTLLAAGDDAGLTIWDLSGSRPTRRQLSDNADFTLEVAISPDGKLLAGGGNDRFVRLWDLQSNRQEARPLIGHTGFVTALAFHPGGETFVSGSEDGTLIVWSVEPRSRVRKHLRHTGRVVSAAFINEHLLATGSFDGTIVLWNLASGEPVASRSIATGEPVEQLVFAGAKNALLACDGQQRLRLWNVRDPKSSATLMDGGCPHDLLTETGTSRVELRPVSDSREIEQDSDYSVTLSDLESRPVRNLTATIKFKWNRTSLALTADRRSLAVGTDNGAVYLWNLQSEPPERRELRGHTGLVADLAFSPDGALLASAGHDGTIRLWDVARGELHQPPIQAPGRVDYVRFNSSGGRLAALYSFSLRERPALQLWDVASGVAIGAPLRGATAWSIGNVVAFSPGGRWVVAGGDEDEILLLDADVASWRAHACRFANRNLSPTDEWPQYFPGQPYHKTCPNLPLPIAVPVIRHDQEDELF